MFLIQIKNIFACWQANVVCSAFASQFRPADLATGETGKQKCLAPDTDVGQTILTSFARPLKYQNLKP